MGINTMENQALPQDVGFGTQLWNFGKVTIAGLGTIALLAIGAKTAYNHYTLPTPISAFVEKASNPYTVRITNQVETNENAPAGYRNYCINGECVQVKLCTAVSDECGDMTPGPKADYGTGFHTSADGRTRPNPPAGWKWGGK